jgi:hypothetical protein
MSESSKPGTGPVKFGHRLFGALGYGQAPVNAFMKSKKLLGLLLCAAVSQVGLMDAYAGCCQDAKKAGKPCAHACCVAAAKSKKSCEKCNPKKPKQDKKAEKKE